MYVRSDKDWISSGQKLPVSYQRWPLRGHPRSPRGKGALQGTSAALAFLFNKTKFGTCFGHCEQFGHNPPTPLGSPGVWSFYFESLRNVHSFSILLPGGLVASPRERGGGEGEGGGQTYGPLLSCSAFAQPSESTKPHKYLGSRGCPVGPDGASNQTLTNRPGAQILVQFCCFRCFSAYPL
jgi:hypothetical protein